MPPFPVIDGHVHFWDPARLHYAWLGSVPPLNRAFLPADFAAASPPVTVEGIVFVEAGRDPAQNLDEARWIAELAACEPRLRGMVAHVALERGAEAVRNDLAALAAIPLVKGVRRLLQDESDDAFCLRPAFVEGVQSLAPFGFTFDLCIYHRQLPAVIDLVRRCPKVTLVLDHLGKPDVRERRRDPWREHIRTLAALPNLWCKLSGLATEADHRGWQPSDLRPYLEHVIDSFGFDRVVFGGDWPVATLATTYPRWIEVVDAVVAGASEPDRRKVFRDNARRLYRLG